MQNDTGVRLSWGLDPVSEQMRHIDSVPKGKVCGCVCPNCGVALVAKQGNVRAHYFSHPSSGQTGGRETCLHKSGVDTMHQRFHNAIQQGEAVLFRWECKACGGEHTHDFAEGITRVEREKRAPDSLKVPDISLYRGSDLCRLIEVVVTHPPEQPVRDYARERGVSLVVVDMKKDPDLDGIIEAEVWEGSVCPDVPSGQVAGPMGNTMPQGKSVATLEEIKEHLGVDINLMEARYGMEFVDHPDIRILEFKGGPVLLREGKYAVGEFVRVQWPITEGPRPYPLVYLRYLTDRRFVLPVAVRPDCDGLRNEALLSRVVLVSCTYVGEGVKYMTGEPYRKWQYRITPLEVDPDTGEIWEASV